MILTPCVEHRRPLPCPECVARVPKCPRCGGLLEPVAGIGVPVPHECQPWPDDARVAFRLRRLGRRSGEGDAAYLARLERTVVDQALTICAYDRAINANPAKVAIGMAIGVHGKALRERFGVAHHDDIDDPEGP